MSKLLVLEPDVAPVLTANVETDAHTALTRGLASYLESLTFVDDSGRDLSLKKVFDTWVEPEEMAEYPSAIVHSPERGEYDGHNFTPQIVGATDDGFSIVKGAEFTLPMYVDIFETDPVARMSLVRMVEDALFPVEWMYGARIALPHYFGTHAEFSLEASSYIDDEAKARQRLRVAHIEVTGAVSLLRAVKLPENKPRLKTEVSTDPLPVPKKRGPLVVT